MNALKDRVVDLDDDEFDDDERADYDRGRASGAIAGDVTFEKWGERPPDDETRAEFLQSLRESIEAGTDDCIPMDEFMAQWGREIDERERAAEGER